MADLDLSEEQRAALGLEAGERVRPLASGRRTILLERLGGDASEALPWDRDLVLTADVRSFALADVLNMVHASTKSGFLYFEHGEAAKSVYLHQGEVIFARSNQRYDRLGEVLLRTGSITPAQHAEAKRIYQPSGHFGKILVEREFLTPRDLWNGLKIQVEEIARSLFSFRAGTVYFWEGEVRPDNVVRLSLPTRRLVAEGLRSRDELLKLLARLEDPRVRLERVDGAEVTLGGNERAMFEALADEHGFPALCRRVGVDPLSGARTVQHLRLVGLLTVKRVSASEQPSAEQEGGGDGTAAIRACVQAHVNILAELVAPMVALEGSDGIRGRLQTVVAEASNRYPEMLKELELGPGGTLDPQVVVDRALRFPGEREREVRLALGELVSYLEFELMNHPSIDDASPFLEGVEALRATL